MIRHFYLIVAIAIIVLAIAPPALAQDPTATPQPQCAYTYRFDGDQSDWSLGANISAYTGSGYDDQYSLHFYQTPGTSDIVATLYATDLLSRLDISDLYLNNSFVAAYVNSGNYSNRVHSYRIYDSNNNLVIEKFQSTYSPFSWNGFAPTPEEAAGLSGQFGRLELVQHYTGSIAHGTLWDHVTLDFCAGQLTPTPTPTPTTTPIPNVCTVSDSEFDNPALWNLGKAAAIASSNLVLGVGDSASQNVSLKSNTTYKIEASVSDLLDGPGSLRLSIGNAYSSIPITARYDYQTTLDTGSVSGPLEVEIFNDSTTGAVIYIDSVCLTEADTSQRTCIAPENGDFQSGSFAGPTGWNLYNGATHDTLNLRAILPYKDPDRAMVSTTSTYAMPTLAAGEYLLLGFSASTDGAAWLGSQAGSSSLSYEVYTSNYDYEADISGQAGQEIDLTFANTGADGFPATGAVYLDNVCVWVSPDPPGLPGPTDPGGITPVDLGWKYGCKDAGAILAGLGINVFQLEDVYAAGVSLWEPSSWVPWLAAALWVNAGKPLTCFMLETFGWLVGMLEYFLNEGLNWADWGRRSGKAASLWGESWFNFDNASNYIGNTAKSWLSWADLSSKNVWSSFSKDNVKSTIQWIKDTAKWVVDSLLSYITGQGDDETVVDGVQTTVDTTTEIIKLLISWVVLRVISLVFVPLDFYSAFQAGINAQSFGSLLTCSGMDFWCTLLAGMQLMNRVSAHTIGYPVVIFGIIVGTIVIFWRWLWELVTIRTG